MVTKIKFYRILKLKYMFEIVPFCSHQRCQEKKRNYPKYYHNNRHLCHGELHDATYIEKSTKAVAK
jgi:hypothetical protein